MTSNDKPKRPGAKPFDRDRKPRDGDRKPGGKKPFAAGAKSGGFSKTERGPAKAGVKKEARSGSGKPERARPAPAERASADGGAAAPERISKLLARAGVASRRDVERMIMEGRVSVNGTVLDTPVLNATFADLIEVDGQPIRGIERTRLWLYHKPAGLVTTNADPEGRPTVFEHLPEDLPRVMSVGRLDINTEGLLLLTNDGGLARVLELPATGWLRRYRVRAHGKIEQEALDKLKEGIAVDGVLYGGIEATLDKVQGSNVWITMGLREGKNREIKNVLGALGLDVNRLIRISYGPFQLGELPEGHAQEIRGRTLRDQLGPRLIDEAKANFEAPLFDQGQGEKEEKPARTEKLAREGRGEREREGRDFREKDGDRREKARARLDTRRDSRGGDRFDDRGGDRHGGDRHRRDDDRFSDSQKREPGNRPRKSNVWMAPGARPVAEKKAHAAEGEEAVKREPRTRPEGAPKSKRYGRNRDGEATRSTHKFDPDRKKAPGRAAATRPGAERGERKARVLGSEDGGDWIRASEPEKRSRDEGGRDFGRGGFGGDRGPRGFGDRPPREDRGGREDRPSRGRSFSSERSFGDRPSRDRSDARSGGGRDGERGVGGKPGGKSFGGKPSFGKSADGKPGGKSFGGKPSFGKPGGSRAGGKPSGKPGGGRPGGGKPRGRGN